MKITVVFRDDTEKVYVDARIHEFLFNGKIAEIKYKNNSKTDFVPMVSVKNITEEEDS